MIANTQMPTSEEEMIKREQEGRLEQPRSDVQKRVLECLKELVHTFRALKEKKPEELENIVRDLIIILADKLKQEKKPDRPERKLEGEASNNRDVQMYSTDESKNGSNIIYEDMKKLRCICVESARENNLGSLEGDAKEIVDEAAEYVLQGIVSNVMNELMEQY